MKPVLFFLFSTLALAQQAAPPPHVGSVWIVPNQNAARFEVIDFTSPITTMQVARTPEISVAWTGGKMSAQGNGKLAESGSVQEKNGRFGRVLDSDFSLPIEPEKFTKGETVWLAVTIWNGAKDSVNIDVPGGHPLAFALDGSQQWTTRTFALANFAPDAGAAITIHVGKAAASALLGAVSLFHEKNLETTRLVELGATGDRSVVTVLAQDLPWDPKIVRHFLLTGLDQAGARAMPLAIDPGVRPTAAMFRFPQAD